MSRIFYKFSSSLSQSISVSSAISFSDGMARATWEEAREAYCYLLWPSPRSSSGRSISALFPVSSPDDAGYFDDVSPDFLNFSSFFYTFYSS